MCYTYDELGDGVITESNGLIYMRARYYSPDMRRFVNADIVAGNISNAVTLNRFSYANGNPVSLIDPFGLSAEREGVDLSTLLSPSDLKRFKEIYDYIDFGIDFSKTTVEWIYDFLISGIKKATRPPNVPRAYGVNK